MSWESLDSSHYLRDTSSSRQLSSAVLLSSLDSRNRLDVYDFPEEYDPRQYRFSFWQCFTTCRISMNQQLAKRKVEQGVRLFNKNKQKAAVVKWQNALKYTRKRDDRFNVLGYLYQGYVGFGKYRQSLEFAHDQLTIAEEMDSPNMRAEAYLNLAKSHERMGNLEKALSYARHSLYNECDQCKTAALVHITVGSVHLELATFCKALDAFQRAHSIAQRIQDRTLEIQVYVHLSELFGRIRDVDRSAMYASKAYDICRTLQVSQVNSRYHRAAMLQMASALRKQGELGDAHDYCSEATRLSLVSGDQPCYTKCIRIMGDIYRNKREISNAYRQYESAMTSAVGMEDAICQIEAMEGAAKCLELLRMQKKICNCRPLQFNKKLLETCSTIGAKLLVRTVRIRLCDIYQKLGDEKEKVKQEKEVHLLDEQLDMKCGECTLQYGLDVESLEVLPCCHILHARCAYEILRKRDKQKKRRCPNCEKIFTSSLYLHDLSPSHHHHHHNVVTCSSTSNIHKEASTSIL